MNLKFTIPIAVVSSLLGYAGSAVFQAGAVIERIKALESAHIIQMETNKEMLQKLSSMEKWLELIAENSRKK